MGVSTQSSHLRHISSHSRWSELNFCSPAHLHNSNFCTFKKKDRISLRETTRHIKSLKAIHPEMSPFFNPPSNLCPELRAEEFLCFSTCDNKVLELKQTSLLSLTFSGAGAGRFTPTATVKRLQINESYLYRILIPGFTEKPKVVRRDGQMKWMQRRSLRGICLWESGEKSTKNKPHREQTARRLHRGASGRHERKLDPPDWPSALWVTGSSPCFHLRATVDTKLPPVRTSKNPQINPFTVKECKIQTLNNIWRMWKFLQCPAKIYCR